MKMNKLFLATFLLGVLVFSTGGVLAVDQPLNVTLGENVTVSISPGLIEFGQAFAGVVNHPATSGDVSFSAVGSNVNVNIQVTGVTGFPFANGGLNFGGADALLQSWSLMTCTITECTSTPQTATPGLDIPSNAAAGTFNGVVTYTITGTPPA